MSSASGASVHHDNKHGVGSVGTRQGLAGGHDVGGFAKHPPSGAPQPHTHATRTRKPFTIRTHVQHTKAL